MTTTMIKRWQLLWVVVLISILSITPSEASLLKKHTSELLETRTNNNNNNNINDDPMHTLRQLSTTFVPLVKYSGSYHITVWIGSPTRPQKQLWIIDTGSRLTATTCQPCPQCGADQKAFALFDPSLTLRNVSSCEETKCPTYSYCNDNNNTDDDPPPPPCLVKQKYTEGSVWTARQVEDWVVLGDDSKTTLGSYFTSRTMVAYPFGCQHHLAGLFRSQYANGILGLQNSPLSIVAHLARANVIPHQAFGLCLANRGGFLTLEHTNSSTTNINNENTTAAQQPWRYTPLQSDAHYAVQVTNVYLNDQCLTCHEDDRDLLDAFGTGKGTLLDSGTTDTYLPGELQRVWAKAFRNITQLKWRNSGGEEQKYTYAEYSRFPTIRLELLNNLTLTMLPHDYVEGLPEAPAATPPTRLGQPNPGNASSVYHPYWTGRRGLSIRVFTTEFRGAVIGMNAMQNKWIQLDATHRRVGLLEDVDCAQLAAASTMSALSANRQAAS